MSYYHTTTSHTPPLPSTPPPPTPEPEVVHVDFGQGPNLGLSHSTTTLATAFESRSMDDLDQYSNTDFPSSKRSSKRHTQSVVVVPPTQMRSILQSAPPERPPLPIRPLQHWFQPVLVLENSGSVARDHLATERTYLAYVRTSLTIASTGVALVQLFTISASSPSGVSRQIQALARPLGATTVAVAFGVLCIGFTRFFSIQSALTKGVFPAARWTVAGITFVLGVLVSVVFGLSVHTRRTMEV